MLTGKDSGVFNKNTNNSGRNTKEDVDFESKELRMFINDALSGQTYAIDLLHAPKNVIELTTPIWEEIIENKSKLITNRISPYVGYVRSQAAKYSKKGEKFNELVEVIGYLSRHPDWMPLADVVKDFDFSKYNHFKLYVKELSETTSDLYFDGPDCSFPCTRKLKDVVPVLKVKLDGFGRRVEDAAKNTGLDLKAYYHALRIVWQLEEYLTTAHITFPSPRVQELRDVRAGKYSKEYIEYWISTEIDRVLAIPNNLPEADTTFWNEWLLDKYMKQAYSQSRKYLRLKGYIK